jgi:hypothetical protein
MRKYPDAAHKDLSGEHAERRADAHKPQKSDASTKRHAEGHDSQFHQRLETDHRTTQ